MKNKRRNHSAQFKAKVALAAAKGDKTVAELASSMRFIRARLTNGKNNCSNRCRRYSTIPDRSISTGRMS